jgi:ribosomal protein S11
MTQFIEVTACENADGVTHIKKVTINPEFIVSITDDNGHATIRMSDSSVVRAVESRDEVSFMLGLPNPVYIK